MAAALLLSLPAIAQGPPQIAIGGYYLPTANSGPLGITSGPDGAVWFTGQIGNFIGRITSAGSITEYSIPTIDSQPVAITAGPDGALWFIELRVNQIGRITTAGTITEYPVPTANSLPGGITAGPDGAVWFTEFNANQIGRITTSGVITEYPVHTGSSQPAGITAGTDGALWFVEYAGNKVARITTTGIITEYPLPTHVTLPSWITAGPDGALWFIANHYNVIFRITTGGVVTHSYSPPSASNGLYEITGGPDNALWFTEYNTSQIGRITTAGVITEYPLPPVNYPPFGGPNGITAGPDGEMWFTENRGIGEAVFVTANLGANPGSGSYHTSLTFTGSGFAPNEKVQVYTSGVGSAVLASAVADSSGSFTASATAPQSPLGPRLFLGTGQRSGKLGAASFSASAKLVLNPTAGAPGSTVTVQGYGFGSLEPVQIYWSSPLTLLGTASANVRGTFNGSAAFTFTVPAGTAPGVYRVLGQFSGVIDIASFTVQ